MNIFKDLVKPEKKLVARLILWSSFLFILAAGIYALIFVDTIFISSLNPNKYQPEFTQQLDFPENFQIAETSNSTNEDNGVAQSNGTSKSKTSINASSSSGSVSTSDSSSSLPDDVNSSPSPEQPMPESLSAYVSFYSDNQSDTDAEDENHRRVVNYILATGANPVFHAGDLMEDGTQDSLDRFNNIAASLLSSRTFYGALGNNDRKIGDSSMPSPLYLANFSFPGNERWYSVNIGNLHMVILDSAFASSSQDQLNWLVSDLQSSASQSRITGVMFHHPSFVSAINSYLINYGVDFVVSGHDHFYQHTISNGINYFVCSGQPGLGYFTEQVYQDTAVMKVYNQSNLLIDTINIGQR